MINFKHITQANETLFKANLGNDYSIERNPVRPVDPSKAMRDGKKGWIGIYRGHAEYEPHAIGDKPYMAAIEWLVEIQIASINSREDCEDRLCDAEKEVIDVIETDRKSGKMGGFIDNIKGYRIDYEMNESERTYYQSALITIKAEQRIGI
jgi:hypothetical protein